MDHFLTKIQCEELPPETGAEWQEREAAAVRAFREREAAEYRASVREYDADPLRFAGERWQRYGARLLCPMMQEL